MENILEIDLPLNLDLEFSATMIVCQNQLLWWIVSEIVQQRFIVSTTAARMRQPRSCHMFGARLLSLRYTVPWDLLDFSVACFGAVVAIILRGPLKPSTERLENHHAQYRNGSWKPSVWARNHNGARAWPLHGVDLINRYCARSYQPFNRSMIMVNPFPVIILNHLT